ncbi:MAG: DUF1385 domain-containing protein [Oscillospiraceae bacterium]
MKKDNVKFRTSIGGQALMEGILMRGPEKQAIVIRKPDGELESTVEPVKALKDKYPILGWPIIRGTVNFLESMIKGVKAITYSASFLPEDEQEEPDKLDLWLEKHFSGETAEKLIIGISVGLGIILAVGLFFLLPTVLAGFVARWIGNGILRNLVEGVLRIVIFLAYIILASKMKEIKRIWQYHGAEHKTIFCYEKGLELTVENCRAQPRQHPRCGTSFLFIVMIVSILVFAVVKWSNVWIRMALRIVLLPVVVGISYEIIKYAGRHDNIVTTVLSAPGKALQLVTTAEPDDSMLEAAIESLKLVIPEEQGSDKW